MFDLKKSRSAYDEKGDFRSNGFAEYSPAYVINNEIAYEVLKLLSPIKGARVLTVAGSGDQPLFYSAMGASVIDTFDISYCAKVIMDIKNTAIRAKMSYNDFVIDLLGCLQGMPDKTSDVLRCFRLTDKMPADTMCFINGMYGCKILRRLGNGWSRCLPKMEMYENAKSHLIENRFIWSDLQNIHTHLKMQYDQIYLSNILSYNNDYKFVVNTVRALRPFVAPYGQIMLHTEYASGIDFQISSIMTRLKDKVSPWANIKYVNAQSTMSKSGSSVRAYILERQR